MEKLVPAGLNNGIHAYLYVCNVKRVVLISRMYLVWLSFSQNICQMVVKLVIFILWSKVYVHGVILLALIILWISLLIHRISFDIRKTHIPHRPPDLVTLKPLSQAHSRPFYECYRAISSFRLITTVEISSI